MYAGWTSPLFAGEADRGRPKAPRELHRQRDPFLLQYDLASEALRQKVSELVRPVFESTSYAPSKAVWIDVSLQGGSVRTGKPLWANVVAAGHVEEKLHYAKIPVRGVGRFRAWLEFEDMRPADGAAFVHACVNVLDFSMDAVPLESSKSEPPSAASASSRRFVFPSEEQGDAVGRKLAELASRDCTPWRLGATSTVTSVGRTLSRDVEFDIQHAFWEHAPDLARALVKGAAATEYWGTGPANIVVGFTLGRSGKATELRIATGAANLAAVEQLLLNHVEHLKLPRLKGETKNFTVLYEINLPMLAAVQRATIAPPGPAVQK